METNVYSEEQLQQLRVDVCSHMSQKRYSHTMGVEREAVRLADLFCPEKKSMLRAAALLHDLTKEETPAFHAAVLEKRGITVTKQDYPSPKTFQARSAALLIPEQYPAFADAELCSAVLYHTTGRAGMTVTEMILYLADYIEDTRTFEDCVKLRRLFWDDDPGAMSGQDRMTHLLRVMITSFDMTIRDLLEGGNPISADTFLARNDLIITLNQMTNGGNALQ